MSIADYVRESRTGQGLPPTVEDPAVLARIATLLRNGGTPGVTGGSADASSSEGAEGGTRHEPV